MSFSKFLSVWSATIMAFSLKPALAHARSGSECARSALFLNRPWVAAILVALYFATCSAAQEAPSNPDTPPEAGNISPVGAGTISPNAILGFESLDTWSVRTTTVVPNFSVGLTKNRTQGQAAYAVANPPTLMKLISSPVPSTATALVGIGQRGALLQLDVLFPCADASADCDPAGDGWIEGYVSSNSLGLHEVSIGKVLLIKYRGRIYNTISFAIPESLGSVLDKAKVNDLVFEFDVSSPSRVMGTYLFDHLRVHSVELVQSPKGTAPPSGYGGSVDLTVTGTKPVKQTFSLDPIQIPRGMHLKKGTTGITVLQFEAGLDSSTAVTCAYVPDATDKSGQSYKVHSCTGNYQAGDIISANWVSLAILGGKASQQVYAQLARRPMGDLTGSGLLPAMPTFWGNSDTCTPAPAAGKVVTRSTSCSNQTAQANAIMTNYFNQVNSAHPPQNWIVSPVPEAAIRRGNTAPANPSTVAPAAGNNVPFDTGGDLNPGGTFDAYWKLSGNLTPTAVSGTDENLTHFDAAFTTHGVLFGNDVDVADAKLNADTDSGETTPVSKPATSSGNLGFYVFGQEIPSGGLSFNPSTGFSVDPTWSQEYDLPPIQIWIFNVTLGAVVDADLKASGSAALSGADLSVTPTASLGAHVSGGIDLGIAKGDVDARVNLISLSAPVTAQAKWVLDNDPAVCATTLNGSLKGDLDVGSGGGEVDLDATFGICPLCYTDSSTLFKWGALASKSWNLFNATIDTQLFGLPASLCNYPITVNIVSPTSGGILSAGLPITLTGSAKPNNSALPYTSTYKWTFTPGANASTAAVAAAGATSAHPIVTFGPPTSGNTSTWTINLTATTTVRGSAGTTITETASAAPVTIQVTNLTPGVHIAQIVSANNGPAVPDPSGVLDVGNVPGTITISGIVAGGPSTPNTTFSVAVCNDDTAACSSPGPATTLVTSGASTATPSASWTGFQGGYYQFTMTTTSGASTFGTASVVIFGTQLF